MNRIQDQTDYPTRPANQRRATHRQFAGGMVDIHCHCLPGLDDGPATLAEALALCRALVEDGITSVVATPHQLGRYDGRNAGRTVREAVEALRAELAAHEVPLAIFPGGDVRLDERIPRMVQTGEVLTLADRVYLLLELPHDSYIDPLPLMRFLARDGIRVIVSHPERYHAVCQRIDLIRPWIDAGAALQVTAGSLLGEFGAEAEVAAWKLLDQPVPLLLASDAHDVTKRPPRMTWAFERVERRLGGKTAKRLCIDNPRRILGLAKVDWTRDGFQGQGEPGASMWDS